MKILIIEDEIGAARRLSRILAEVLPQAQIVDIISSVEQALAFLKKENGALDLIMMDIHLSDGSAFDILEKVPITCPIIFTTAYDEYAMEAFKHNSIDYLLKPIKKESLEHAYEKLQRFQLPQSNQLDYQKLAKNILHAQDAHIKRFVIKYGGKIKTVEIAEVAYCYIQSKVTFLKTFDGRSYGTDYNLEELEEMLPKQRFFRFNRSCIVQVSAIDEMYRLSKSRIKLKLRPPADFEIIASTEKTSDFKKWLPQAERTQ